MKRIIVLLAWAGMAMCQTAPQVAAPPVTSLREIKRVYVDVLSGDKSAEALRSLIITSLQQTHLFLVTDNPEKADATIRGAANDTSYTDSFDSQESASAHHSAGAYIAQSISGKTGGFGGSSASDNETTHIKERKHEAFASVRLSNRDGDILWATTQESRGAKFHGASADVAEKIVRQLQFDFNRPLPKTSHTESQSGLAPAATK